MSKHEKQIVTRLLDPGCYTHHVTKVELVETHVSRIFLAGEFAYKMKKPVNFGFLDFSTLKLRQFYCNEELRLNRRFAPQLYLDVCTIGGEPEKVVFGGVPVQDYLVKMVRFPRHKQLDQLLKNDQLTAAQIEDVAKILANFHATTARAPSASEFGSPSDVTAPVLNNFKQLHNTLTDPSCAPLINELESWSKYVCEAYSRRFEQRKASGFVRECHGDLHLANMVWWKGHPLLFDCIEFNPNLRWIDLLSEVAFLVMDLDDHAATKLGWRFLNTYLQWTGDYRDLDLLRFYKVYRAMVRCKVISLRLKQHGLSATDRRTAIRLLHSYLELGCGYLQPRKKTLVISHGLSGSGKTSFIKKLAARCGAISIHSDIERKRSAGLAPIEASHSATDTGLYTPERTEATYQELLLLAESILHAGLPVLVDATFLRQAHRNLFRQLAKNLNIQFFILDFQRPEAELRHRVRQRLQQTEQNSEATEQVLDKQLVRQEHLTDEEILFSHRICDDKNLEDIASRLS